MDDEERKLIEAGYIKATLWLTPEEARMVRAMLAALRNPPEGMPPPLRKGRKTPWIDLSPKKKPPEGG